MTATKLPPAQMDNKGVFTGTDPNGWAVTDYGTHKIATRTEQTTASKVRFEIGTQGSVNLPTGVSTVADLKFYTADIMIGTYSDFVTLTRCNSSGSSTSLSWVYQYMGPTTSTSYTIPVKFTVIW